MKTATCSDVQFSGRTSGSGGRGRVGPSFPAPAPTCCRPDPKQLQETHSKRGINKSLLRFFFFKAFSSPKMVQMCCVPIRLLCFFQSAGWAGYSSLLCSPLPASQPAISPRGFFFFPRQMKLHGPFLPSFLEAKTGTKEGVGNGASQLLSTRHREKC